MAFKMKGIAPLNQTVEGTQVSKTEFKTWADNELKTNPKNWTKSSNKKTWVDSKGRSLRQVYQGVQGEQRDLG